MNSLSRILHSGNSRGLLLGLVGLLALVKLGLWLQDTYQADQAVLASRQADFARSRKLTGKIPELRSQLQHLEGEKEGLRKFLFTGANEENIISAMQLDLQAMVTSAGLVAETIRPLKQKNAQDSGDESILGEVAIKTSLNGTLAEYLIFLTELYHSPKVYKIEAVVLTPLKKSELKILIDLRGYFVIAAPEVAVAPEAGGAAKPTKTLQSIQPVQGAQVAQAPQPPQAIPANQAAQATQPAPAPPSPQAPPQPARTTRTATPVKESGN